MTNTTTLTQPALPLSPDGSVRPVPLARAERDAAIVARRATGESLASIGADFGLTRERVRQIAAAGGCPDRSGMKRLRADRRHAQAQALRDRCLAHLEHNPGIDLKALADAMAATQQQVRAALGRDGRRLLAAASKDAERISDEDLLGELRFAAGLIRGPLTGSAFRRVSRGLGLHSHVLMVQRFGTWQHACALAGVTPGSPRRAPYTRSWTREDMLTWVALYLDDPSSRGTYAGYDRFARQTDGAPSSQTVRNAIGPWSIVKADALRLLAGAPRAQDVRASRPAATVTGPAVQPLMIRAA